MMQCLWSGNRDTIAITGLLEDWAMFSLNLSDFKYPSLSTKLVVKQVFWEAVSVPSSGVAKPGFL